MFQSTHPHGVRRYSRRPSCPPSCFNPRTHTGCDLWGLVYCGLTYSFNPRTHTGCDCRVGHGIVKPGRVSIHAPTRGATKHPDIIVIADEVSIHAPTRGATIFFKDSLILSGLFQSTHPHGVRHYIGSNVYCLKGFNPRTHTGCDSVQSYIL